MPSIKVRLNSPSIAIACRIIEDYRDSIQEKTHELCKRLADHGLYLAYASFASAMYDGNKDVHVDVEETDTGYRIVASGSTALILEFGAGITYGYGHPQAAEFGMGPGTYPGQKHAFDPHGWTIPKYVPVVGGTHTYGNPPSMTMYNTAKDLRAEVQRIAEEVFASD